MKLRPFPALRPVSQELAARIASLPYDVMDTDEARAMAAGNPDSFLHVIRAEIDLPAETDPHTTAVYEKSRDALQALIADGRLIQDSEPALYIYRQIWGSHKQTSLVACCNIDDYADGTILRHEKTRKDKEDDRTNHILTTNANTGQVFLTYKDNSAVDALVEAETVAAPIYDFVSEDGIGHVVWRVRETAAVLAAFEAVERAYIADGHHRSAASYRAGAERRKANPSHDGTEEYNGFMACLFPASQLRILEYNRLVLTLRNMSHDGFLDCVKEVFDVTDTDKPAPDAPGSCHMYLGKRWYRLGWRVAEGSSPVASLDVSVLQDRLLGPVLGIGDPRTDTNIVFVGGIRGTAELVRRVDSDEAAVAFSMYATTIEELMAISDAGETMPPKSTWFEPKLRSGLLVHFLD